MRVSAFWSFATPPRFNEAAGADPADAICPEEDGWQKADLLQ